MDPIKTILLHSLPPQLGIVVFRHPPDVIAAIDRFPEKVPARLEVGFDVPQERGGQTDTAVAFGLARGLGVPEARGDSAGSIVSRQTAGAITSSDRSGTIT